MGARMSEGSRAATKSARSALAAIVSSLCTRASIVEKARTAKTDGVKEMKLTIWFGPRLQGSAWAGLRTHRGCLRSQAARRCRPARPPRQSPTAPRTGGTLRYGLTLPVSGIDPHIHANSELGIALSSVYDTLVVQDKDGIVPPVAGRKVGDERGRQELHLLAAQGRQVPRRHALQRRGGSRAT